MKQALFLTASIMALLGATQAHADTTGFTDISSSFEGWLSLFLSPNGNALGGESDTYAPIVVTFSGTTSYLTTTTSFSYNSKTYTGTDGYVLAMSDTGIAGIVNMGTDGNRAAYWSNTTAAPVYITAAYGDQYSEATGISANGSYVVGDMGTELFLYKTSNGALTFITPSSGYSLNTTGISNDGSVISGSVYDQTSHENYASYWFSSGGYSSSGSDYAQYFLSYDQTSSQNVSVAASDSNTTAVSKNGAVIVGYSYDGSKNNPMAWTRSSSNAALYTPTVLSYTGYVNGAMAMAVNGDGSVIVGVGLGSAGARTGLRWASGTVETIAQWLSEAGITVNLGSGITIGGASGVSSDGNTVAGWLSNNDAYIARVAGTGSGLVTINDLAASLANNSIVPASVSLTGDLVMHGAHGHPLLHLAPEGKTTAWTNGDFGFSSNSDAKAYSDVAEIGIGQRISKNVQLNLSVGKIYAGQKTAFDGNFHQDMTFILPEAIINIPETPVWTTLSFQYAGGALDAKRGYLNAGVQDYSTGGLQGDIYTGRVRFDWKDALTLENFSFTPYVDHEHSEIALSSYSESGGGFPANWDSRHEHDDISRIGIDVTKPIDKEITLLFTAEQNHWWQGKGTASSGEVIGLSRFSLPGVKYAKDWAHFSVGLTKDINKNGSIAAIANASTSGQNPQYWFNIGYQYHF